MEEKTSFKELMLYYSVRFFGCLIRYLPIDIALGIGRLLGALAYYGDARRRQLVLLNLRTAFGREKSVGELLAYTGQVFQNYGQNIIELLRMPLMTRQLFQRYVRIEGQEHIREALKQGRGVILLAMHYGSWELANMISSVMEHPYKVIVKPQTRYSRLDKLLTSYRECGGGVTLQRGVGTRDLVRSLRRNEIVALVMDQGGKNGIQVPFFGRRASMSDGAIRLGLKLGVPICFAAINREKGPYHRIVIRKPLTLDVTGNTPDDVRTNTAKVVRTMESVISENPSEYMWFYKVWKYSRDAVTVILNDGRTGHLRQSQAVARILERSLASRGYAASTRVIDVTFRGKWAPGLVPLAGLLPAGCPMPGRVGSLAWFLTEKSYQDLMSVRADFVVSCGSKMSGLNYLVARSQQARNIMILKPGWPGFHRFSLVVLPEHDVTASFGKAASVVVTRGAPNLINREYLERQSEALLTRFSHLKGRDRFRIGLFIGGDTKEFPLSEKRLLVVVHQIMEAATAIDADVLVTTSRRTPEKVENMLQRELKPHPCCQLLILANRSDVPEAMGGILGLADIALVSADSISMISEAASSGKKTVVFKPYAGSMSHQRRKHDRFIEGLNARGYVLSSTEENLKNAVYDLAKNKIQTRMLDDHAVLENAIAGIL